MFVGNTMIAQVEGLLYYLFFKFQKLRTTRSHNRDLRVQAKPFSSKEHFFTGDIVTSHNITRSKVLSDLTIGFMADPCIKTICFMGDPDCLRVSHKAYHQIWKYFSYVPTEIVHLPTNLAYSSSNWQRRVVELDEVLFQFQTARTPKRYDTVVDFLLAYYKVFNIAQTILNYI